MESDMKIVLETLRSCIEGVSAFATITTECVPLFSASDVSGNNYKLLRQSLVRLLAHLDRIRENRFALVQLCSEGLYDLSGTEFALALKPNASESSTSRATKSPSKSSSSKSSPSTPSKSSSKSSPSTPSKSSSPSPSRASPSTAISSPLKASPFSMVPSFVSTQITELCIAVGKLLELLDREYTCKAVIIFEMEETSHRPTTWFEAKQTFWNHSHEVTAKNIRSIHVLSALIYPQSDQLAS